MSGFFVAVQRLVRRWRCSHEWRLARNIYGDEINLMNGRSWWVCYKCGAGVVRRELHTPNKAISRNECSECGGSGVVDSGGVTPWGTGIDRRAVKSGRQQNDHDING